MSLMRPLSFLFPLVLVASAIGCTTQTGGATGGPDGPVDLPEQERVDAPANSGGTTPGGEKQPGASVDPAQMYKLPAWQREDVQPKSARFGQSYGLDQYSGKTVVVVLLEGYCPYCQSNSVVAQNLQNELDAEQLDAQIVILGDPNAEQFASRVALPIFRDKDKSAWNEMRSGASKHDTFVFSPSGERTYFWLGSYQGDATRWRADIGKAVRDVAKKKP